MGSWDQVHWLRREFIPPQTLSPRGETGGQGGLPEGLSPDRFPTPQEALAYIEHLYRTGRMSHLAKLLRAYPVFREAWLTVQCFPQMLQGAARGRVAPGQVLSQSGISTPTSRIRPSSLPSSEVKESRTFPLPRFEHPGSPSWGLSVYKRQEQYFSNDKASHPAINLRV